VIAATGINLADVLGKTFRKDLFYRLSVVRIHLPPLRERRGDIPQLCDYLLGTLSGAKGVKLAQDEYARLMEYDWPGNVRELKNVLERAVMLQTGAELRPSRLLDHEKRIVQPVGEHCSNLPETVPLDEVEKRHIRYALEKFAGNYTKTAKALGVSLSTLKRKIKAL
jgi:transcriptional regulator with PAS, ATPase and Fis domain